MAERICSVPECSKPTRSMSAELCKMHYHRQYRHGDVNRVATSSGITASLGRKYRRVRAVGHPLADKSGNAYEHRVMLYASIGAGPHACIWCGESVEWGHRNEPGCLCVDHLNGDTADNRPENLAPACRTCNSMRGMQAKSRLLRAAGWWSGNDTIAHLSSGGRRDDVEPAA